MTVTDHPRPELAAAAPNPGGLLSPRRAKIVCTLGPAVADDARLRELVESGMDIARLNFSHGDHTDHQTNYDRVRAAATRTGRAVGILADLQGPKIRLGRFTDGATVWANGDTVCITVDDCPGDHDRVSTTYKELARDAKAGDRLLVDDGKLALTVTAVEGPDSDVNGKTPIEPSARAAANGRILRSDTGWCGSCSTGPAIESGCGLRRLRPGHPTDRRRAVPTPRVKQVPTLGRLQPARRFPGVAVDCHADGSSTRGPPHDGRGRPGDRRCGRRFWA